MSGNRTVSESKQPTKEQAPNMREHFSGLFEIALVLLGVLSATETPYFIKVWGDVTAIKFSTTPFIVMIPVWLIKELFKHKIPIENACKNSKPKKLYGLD